MKNLLNHLSSHITGQGRTHGYHSSRVSSAGHQGHGRWFWRWVDGSWSRYTHWVGRHRTMSTFCAESRYYMYSVKTKLFSTDLWQAVLLDSVVMIFCNSYSNENIQIYLKLICEYMCTCLVNVCFLIFPYFCFQWNFSLKISLMERWLAFIKKFKNLYFAEC